MMEATEADCAAACDAQTAGCVSALSSSNLTLGELEDRVSQSWVNMLCHNMSHGGTTLRPLVIPVLFILANASPNDFTEPL